MHHVPHIFIDYVVSYTTIYFGGNSRNLCETEPFAKEIGQFIVAVVGSAGVCFRSCCHYFGQSHRFFFLSSLSLLSSFLSLYRGARTVVWCGALCFQLAFEFGPIKIK